MVLSGSGLDWECDHRNRHEISHSGAREWGRDSYHYVDARKGKQPERRCHGHGGVAVGSCAGNPGM